MTVHRSHVVGSMLRPDELLEARERRAANELSPASFKRIEDAAVDRAIATQESAGIDVITDGEQRRFDFMEGLLATVSGIEDVSTAASASRTAEQVVNVDGFWHRDDTSYETHEWVPPVITTKLRRTGSLVAEEYSYARSKTSHPVKVTLPNATLMVTYWSDQHSRAAYNSVQDAIFEFADILKDEISQLASLGCEHVQIDSPDLTMLIDPSTSFLYEMLGFSRAQYIDMVVELLNGVAAVPGITFSVHLCRGNKEGEWHSSGGYGAISKDVFPRLKGYDYLFLEFDDERSGDFQALSDVPHDRCVVLGLVSTKRAEIEKPDALLKRIDDAAKFFPRDQLALSPQCGFASILYGNPITAEVERAKLELVAEVAAQAWN